MVGIGRDKRMPSIPASVTFDAEEGHQGE
jgi:hypothetical protein